MAHLDKKGPEKELESAGRGLGFCNKDDTTQNSAELGKGRGLRCQSGGGKGLAKRLKASNKIK